MTKGRPRAIARSSARSREQICGAAAPAIATAVDPLLDSLTNSAAAITRTPLALLLYTAEVAPRLMSIYTASGDLSRIDPALFATFAAGVGELIFIEDIATEDRLRAHPFVQTSGVRAAMIAPLMIEDAQIGLLGVFDTAQHTFDDAERAAFISLAQSSACAIERAVVTVSAHDPIIATDEMMAEVFRNTPAMLHSLDKDGTLVDVSDAWLKRMAYRRDEIIGRPWPSLMTAESAKYAREVTVPTFFRDSYCDEIEYQVNTGDGRLLDVSISAVMQPEVPGRPQRSLAIMQDITDRRRTERELIENRDELNRVLEGTDASTWEWNVLSGEIRANDKWRDLLGYSLEDIPIMNAEQARNLAHPDDRRRSARLMAAHLRGDSDHYECELRLRHKLGHWVWVLRRGRVSRRYDETVWVSGTQMTIGERKRAELAVSAAKQLLEQTGKIAKVGGWEFDLLSGAATFSEQTNKILELDDGASLSLEESISKFAPSAQTRARDIVSECIDAGASFVEDLPMYTIRGRLFWARVAGEAVYENDQVVRIVGAIQDVSREHAAEQKLAESRELLQVTLESIGDAVITTLPDGSIRWMNSVAEHLTGWENAAALGKGIDTVFESTRAVNDGSTSAVAECLSTGEVVIRNDSSILLSRDGSEYGIQESASPITARDGTNMGAVLVFRDVSEQRRLAEEIHYRAAHDALTGLKNRLEFEARLNAVLAGSKEKGSSHALMYIDLDEFKIVNDSCGHHAGDELLKRISNLFSKCVRQHDILARLGGDEFGVILEDCTVGQAMRVAQEICEMVSEYRFTHDGQRYRIGTSIGLVPVDAKWKNIAMILKAADAACYAAKERGRNRVHVWYESDQTILARQSEMRWTQRIEQAIDEDQFVLYAQRIAPCQTNIAGIHCEVLLRIQNPDGTTVPPNSFFPAAERYHLASRIDRWVIDHVFDWVDQLGDEAAAFGTIAINLSGQSISDDAFRQYLEDKLAATPIDPGKICFEITETAAITRLAEANKFIARMHNFGIRSALDDFGAGASSFGYLKSLRVDYLKIDGQFIRDLNDDALDLATVRCFVDVAKVIGIQTIAEFVERPETFTNLREIGVDFAQGNLFHSPAPIDTFRETSTAPVESVSA